MRAVVCIGLFIGAMAGSALAGPLDKPAFTATPAELLAEAGAAAPTDHGVVVLLDDATYTFDARGRLTARYRTVFTVRAPSGVDDWGTLHLGWAPFHQDRPVIRARVVGTDGSVTEFDPSLVHDAPAVEESPSVFSDRRALSVPLPRLAVGAVVEQEYTIVDREPLLAAGTVHWLQLSRGVPIARELVTISAPTALRAKLVLRGTKAAWKPTTRKVGDRTIVRYDLANLAPTGDDDVDGAPVDWLDAPALGIATGASWAAVAADYRALVEAQLVAPVALPPDLVAATPRATVDRVLAWLHGRVRDTGIELSASALVPTAPGTTLTRGFGDDRDKAVLLVALLRAAKIPADLAILSTGPGVDVDVALPGVGEFDHAIVRARVDGKDLWIDATADRFAAGQLPMRDQGRRALVLAAGTKALTTTPVGAPVDNLVREVRTFHLSEHGPSTLTETIEARGTWSDNLRGLILDSTRDEVASQLATYVAEEYLGTYRSHRSTPAGDVTTPVVLTTEVDHVERTEAEHDELRAWVFPTDVLDRVPGLIDGDDEAFDVAAKARTLDYLWPQPHVYEIVNRFEVPTGFSPPELAASETRALGTMTLTTTRSFAAGVYTVAYRLDTGKRLITADQLRATRAAARALHGAGSDQLTFPLEAVRLAGLGKVREAIVEIQRLVALHPNEAIHHLQLAIRYQTLGLVEAARREAKLATTLEPKNANAWALSGFLLSRGLAGDTSGVGSDRPAALAALRKAIAIRPTHAGARKELSWLLAIDATGWVSNDRAEHREAATLLRALRAEKLLDDADNRLVLSLAMSDDRAGLEAMAKELPDGATRHRIQVLVAALTSADEARRVATSIAGAHGREALLDDAVGSLVFLRRYDAARAVARYVRSRSASALDRLREIDVARLPPRDPTTPVILMMRRLVLGAVASAPWSAETEAALEDAAFTPKQQETAAGMFDDMVANASLTTRGDEQAGWTVRLTMRGTTLTQYVVLRNQRAYLLGGPRLLAGLGREVHDLLGRGDLDGARALLTRVIDDPTIDLQTDAAQLLRRHRAGFATAPKPRLEIFGWALLGDASPLSAVPRLRACADLTAQEDRFDCLRMGTEIAGARRDWTTASELARGALALSPDLPATIAMLAMRAAFAPAGNATAEAAVADALLRHPGHVELLRAQAAIALATSWTAAAPRFDQLVAGAKVDPGDLNNAAWTHLFYDPSPAVARTLIERAMNGVSNPPPHHRNTYAAVLAEAGDLTAASDQFARSVSPRAPLRNADWYVLGRIAEQAGLRDDAIAIYRRVTGNDTPGIPSSWHFAQKRLKAMGVTP